jgi:hypothetical protein
VVDDRLLTLHCAQDDVAFLEEHVQKSDVVLVVLTEQARRPASCTSPTRAPIRSLYPADPRRGLAASPQYIKSKNCRRELTAAYAHLRQASPSLPRHTPTLIIPRDRTLATAWGRQLTSHASHRVGSYIAAKPLVVLVESDLEKGATTTMGLRAELEAIERNGRLEKEERKAVEKLIMLLQRREYRQVRTEPRAPPPTRRGTCTCGSRIRIHPR